MSQEAMIQVISEWCQAQPIKLCLLFERTPGIS